MSITPLEAFDPPTDVWLDLPSEATCWTAADGNFWQTWLSRLRDRSNEILARLEGITATLGMFGEPQVKGTVGASTGTQFVPIPPGTALQVLAAGQDTPTGVGWVNLRPGAWTSPAFPTEWNTSTLQYRVAGDRIEWRGDLIRVSASTPTGTETMCTLPPEARPPATVNLKWAGAIGSNTGIFGVTITTAGVVSVNTASNSGSLPPYATFCPTGLTYSTT